MWRPGCCCGGGPDRDACPRDSPAGTLAREIGRPGRLSARWRMPVMRPRTHCGYARPMVDSDPVFELHRGGKMAVQSTVPLSSREDLSLAYTPGGARVGEATAGSPGLAREYTWTSHAVAVVTDGSAVLGLGN